MRDGTPPGRHGNSMTDSEHGARTTCLDDLTLARYADGGGTPEERRRVQSHLGECDDCYSLLADVVYLNDDQEVAAVPVGAVSDDVAQSGERTPAPALRTRGRGRILVGAGALIAAAAAVFVVLLPGDAPLDPLVAAVGSERIIAARPTGGFQYGALRSEMRSGEMSDRLAVKAVEAQLGQQAKSGQLPDVHAWGVAQLLAGETGSSVRTLEQVAEQAPDVAAYHADLGAARLTLYLEERRDADAAAALQSLDRALTIASSLAEARFNRALLLSALGRGDEARAAWDAYLAVDATSPWADEARRQKNAIQ